MRLLYLFFPLFLFSHESLAQLTFETDLNNDLLRLSHFSAGNLISSSYLKHDGLVFNNEDEIGSITYPRAILNKDGLTFINDGSWLTAKLYNSGSSGALDLRSGGGSGLIFSVGPDPGDATQGRMYLYDGGAEKVEMRVIQGSGIVSTQGQNESDNTSLTWPSGRPNAGYIICEDPDGQIQAGLVVNSDGTGSVFADTKNFRMEHPEHPGKEIWYASLEGPEAAAYERGSTKLQRGKAFIPFSDHFQLVINPETLTVILTPHSADTYGLAVVEKMAGGFWVQELKGGKGNFGFDWEVKAVRSGYENYRVIRDASEMIPGHRETSEVGYREMANN